MTRRLADRYLVGEQIGVGGSSRVFAAHDERLGRDVAIKCLDDALAVTADPAGRERFLREGKSAAKFVHPHAVTVFDAGEDDGELYIVLELVRGPSLAARLSQPPPLSIAEAVHIARQVSSALAAAHTVGMVHRDVTPANILLDETGEAKLADFGLARSFDDLEASVTAIGMVAGTPKYLAPEQLAGSDVTPAADVYAVGVVMFEMLAGRVPFDGGSPTATAAMRHSTDAPDVRTIRPEVPVALAELIARALSRDPVQRPQNAQNLVDELSELELRGALDQPGTAVFEPVTRTQIQPRAAFDGPTPRRRWGAGSAVLIAVGFLGLVLLLGSVLGNDDIESATDEALVQATAGPTTIPPVEPTAAPAIPAETVAPVPEVIPGFPATDQILVFLAQVQQNPPLVGPAGPELGDRLQHVLDEQSRRKRNDAAEKLRDWSQEQLEAQALDPAIAALLDQLLSDLTGGGNGDGDDD